MSQENLPVEKPKALSLDDKLDKIMEAIVFQQQILLGALKAIDSLLADKQKIIRI